MKKYWECEVCGERFYDEDRCIVHEHDHKRLEEEKAEKEKLEKESLDNLNKLYEEYYDAVRKHQENFGNPIVHKFTYPLFDFWRNFID